MSRLSDWPLLHLQMAAALSLIHALQMRQFSTLAYCKQEAVHRRVWCGV